MATTSLIVRDTYLLLERAMASYQGERPEGVHWFMLADGATLTMTTQSLLAWGRDGLCIHLGSPDDTPVEMVAER